MKFTKRSVFISVVIILTIAVDQISKIIVRANIIGQTSTQPSERIPIIGDVFWLMNVENEGAFLGMGSNLNPTLRLILLLILPILVLAFVLHYIIKDKSLDKLSLFAYASIIGGGIANIYDRLFLGSVTDFLFIDFGGVFKTGIFNMADVSVTTGMIILVITNFKKKKVAN
ncbi:lipoprotein signal peptidase [Tamlana nanhaiensis]|uniref:Lipoprotein signal peptidase n=1 Tax=Neotamlana nanhaiensis TaxID=1382798 RepID=A0A0D7VYH2_9FLAO|nr:signal peptidase II [Tamlana nanhaiensis]KJD31930.1 lipoprotein signal peptidase [Tamlana nanhaiensis]